MKKDGTVRGFLFQNQRITQTARIAKAAVCRFRGIVHDPDFHALTIIPEPSGLALDIGANTGQSAIAILAVKPGFSVLSIEPNPACHAILSTLAKLYSPNKLQVLHAGAGEHRGELKLSVPVRNGREILGEATFDIEIFDEPITISRIGTRGTDYTLAEKICPVVKIDELNKNPIFVKIDVQGLELDVLRGMTDTIRKSLPLIMIERGTNEDDCGAFLAQFGYVRRYWNGEKMIDTVPPTTINVFFLPPPLQNA